MGEGEAALRQHAGHRPLADQDPFIGEFAERDSQRQDDDRTADAARLSAIAPMIAGPWAMGECFTLADCAALPALFYADYSVPLATKPRLVAYLSRLKARPSVARVLREAEPFFQYFPLKDG